MEPVETRIEDEEVPSPEPEELAEVPAAAAPETLEDEIRALEAEGDSPTPVPECERYAITPLYDRVLVRREEAAEARRGIVIADTIKQKPQRGIVLAVGNGRIIPGLDHYIAPIVAPGQRVLFGMYAGVEVELDSDGRETALILREDEIIAVVETYPREGPIQGAVLEGKFGEGEVPPEPAEPKG